VSKWDTRCEVVSGWLDSGVPQGHVAQVTAVAAVSQVLERYLRLDRIPDVVRRPALMLGGASLLSLVATGRTAEALALTRQMFDPDAIRV
jgi:hypothetical protein